MPVSRKVKSVESVKCTKRVVLHRQDVQRFDEGLNWKRYITFYFSQSTINGCDPKFRDNISCETRDDSLHFTHHPCYFSQQQIVPKVSLIVRMFPILSLFIFRFVAFVFFVEISLHHIFFIHILSFAIPSHPAYH